MIKYKCGYKYQLNDDYVVMTGIPGCAYIGRFLEIGVDGKLIIRAGYAWDGASGVAIDTKNFMRGSLVHDALYQLMRKGAVPMRYRKTADDRLRIICKKDGMSSARAWWVYRAVRSFGESSALSKNAKKVITAP